MVARGTPLPKKLKNDAIIEAILEIQFSSKENDDMPELFIARLADIEAWKNYSKRPLPIYDIPISIRKSDPNLRTKPVIELVSPDNLESVRIGLQVISFHRRAPYVGWDELFKPKIFEMINTLFSKTNKLTIARLGLRYINALSTNEHYISSLKDLDLKLEIAGEYLTESLNINFTTTLSDNTNCTVRVASPEFIQGIVPEDTNIIIDVDVFTKNDYSTNDSHTVHSWLDFAHDMEKIEFFHLLPQDVINKLKI